MSSLRVPVDEFGPAFSHEEIPGNSIVRMHPKTKELVSVTETGLYAI